MLSVIRKQIGGIVSPKKNSDTSKEPEQTSEADNPEPTTNDAAENYNEGMLKDVLVHLANKDKPLAPSTSHDIEEFEVEDKNQDIKENMQTMTEAEICVTWSGSTFAEALKYYSDTETV